MQISLGKCRSQRGNLSERLKNVDMEAEINMFLFKIYTSSYADKVILLELCFKKI